MHHHADQIVLVARVEKERSFGHLGASGDVGGCGMVEPASSEDGPGSLQDSVSLVGLLSGSRSPSRSSVMLRVDVTHLTTVADGGRQRSSGVPTGTRYK